MSSSEFNSSETTRFLSFVNFLLANDQHLQAQLPLPTDLAQFAPLVKDGIILSKLLNIVHPSSVDEAKLSLQAKTPFQLQANQQLLLDGLKKAGVNQPRLTAADLNDANQVPIIGVIHLLIFRHVIQPVTGKAYPELERIKYFNSSIFSSSSASTSSSSSSSSSGTKFGSRVSIQQVATTQELMLRWFNYHLSKARHSRRVSNFDDDLKDGVNYIVFFHQLFPQLCDPRVLMTENAARLADIVIDIAKQIGTHHFLMAEDILSGQARLNYYFLVYLYTKYPTYQSAEEAALINTITTVDAGNAEARHMLWTKTLAIQYITEFFTTYADAVFIFTILNKVAPSDIDWSKVNKKPSNNFKKTENWTELVRITRKLGHSVSNVQVSDVSSINMKVTLELLSTIVNYDLVHNVSSGVSEVDLLAWANDKITAAGKSSTIQNFKDKSIKTGQFFADLLAAIDATYSPTLVDASSDDGCMANARAIVQALWKTGFAVYLMPEDIVNVNSIVIQAALATMMKQLA